MKLKWIWVSTAAALLVMAGVLIFTKPTGTRMSEEILARSKSYIERYGRLPSEDLTMEERLVLLHSYFNVRDDRAVARLAEEMKNDIRALPAERQKAFFGMIRQAYLRLGKMEKAEEYSIS